MPSLFRVPRPVAAIVAVVILAGCAGPEDDKPALDIPGGWKAEGPAGTSWPDTAWWRTFGSPQLDQLIQTAQRNNQDIGAAVARVLQADAQARISGAPLLPSVGADGNASHSVSPERTVSGFGGSSTNRTVSDQFSAELSVSYELDLWGRNRSALQSAQASALASRYDRDTVALTVTASTATTYMQILEFQDRLAIARDNLANAQQVLTIVLAQEQAGAGSALDVAQQRTVVAQQKAAIPPLEQQRQQSETALALLLGEAPERLSLDRQALDELDVPSVGAGLPSSLLDRRPDVQNADAQLAAARFNVKEAKAALFPSIQLTGSGGFQSAALGTLFNSANTLYSLAASLTQPIFEGGALRGQVQLSEAQYQELGQTYVKTVLAAFGDVENALIATRQAGLAYQAQQEVVAQSREAFRLSEAQYRAGAVDLLTVLNAQQSYFSARDQLVQAKSDRLQAAVALYKALGGGWSAASAKAAAGS
ncbi:MAG: efflux transporter outer membrane subunit [Inquilinus limosus]|uniref:Efflux transporter outer membrane subunit n=1 Tax=Inquilinus limosus TaxID=171674 RepID=A0A952FMK7_9PROT|nr:efflux transporter outer membrane subunit [Inquilinus limosus]